MGMMETLEERWNRHEGPAVFSTVDPDGTPNAIYVGELRLDAGRGFVIADHYFDKTRRNIDGGSRGSLLFIDGDGKAFQAKGSLSYHTEGPVFHEMKGWQNPKHPGNAAVVLEVEELYSGAEKLAGVS
ncbi:pyridoxamine 5'-phosphate oxidase family protein [Kiritimatiella glycovorans]|uniref:Pyridoxamine 5'-phosphate oxidase n=1 Tax=Kiritimatiella glycovorans TaxID=1307763 RepID=A0A0G3EAV8_9BACT|nr:pyridoxamine 5'-phosphate oxidase family protein [Kiritimatiella glycovorans]AKJ63403.1 Pyridoxamine 5'-phosphate oxidase [Kiritimatiella glycovorans]